MSTDSNVCLHGSWPAHLLSPNFLYLLSQRRDAYTYTAIYKTIRGQGSKESTESVENKTGSKMGRNRDENVTK